MFCSFFESSLFFFFCPLSVFLSTTRNSSIILLCSICLCVISCLFFCRSVRLFPDSVRFCSVCSQLCARTLVLFFFFCPLYKNLESKTFFLVFVRASTAFFYLCMWILNFVFRCLLHFYCTSIYHKVHITLSYSDSLKSLRFS